MQDYPQSNLAASRRNSRFQPDPSLASLASSFSSFSCASSTSGDSPPPSLLFSPSTSASPASSLASSPSLDPKRSYAFAPPPLSLDSPPSSTRSAPIDPTQVTQYAAQIIRNEAYALLALAARLAPAAAQPFVSDDELYPHRSAPESCGSSEGEYDEQAESPASMEGVPAPFSPELLAREETITNVAFRQVVDLVLSMPSHGKILVSGIGKSGIVGRKMVATMNSLGIQAVFLHPLEALHGDLGVVCSCSPSSPCDTLFMISHSGATAELMRLLPIVRTRVRSLVAITRDPESILAKACDGWLDAATGVYPEGLPKGTTDEADSTLPAPTNSVVTALAIGDALALTLSRLRVGWEKDGKDRRAAFFHCHPGGQLGLQLGREGRGIDVPPHISPSPAIAQKVL